MTGEEVVMAYFKLLFQHLNGNHEETKEMPVRIVVLA
jgi:hypothetical protein